jgi:hypothetical protein
MSNANESLNVAGDDEGVAVLMLKMSAYGDVDQYAAAPDTVARC